jgi:hypothetical protein
MFTGSAMALDAGWSVVTNAGTVLEGGADDVLQFLGGATMHGALQAIEPGRGLRWQHPDAKRAFDLQPAHLDCLRFPRSQPTTNSPGCHFRFLCGDELFGSLVSMTQDDLELNTWFGATLRIPRAAIQTISFLPKDYSLIYEGPTDASGWVMGGPQGQRMVVRGGQFGNIIIMGGGQLVMGGVTYGGANPNGTTNWAYHDGSFVSAGVGTLGRDFHLSGSSTIDFDVACGGSFNLLMQLYTTTLDRMDFNNGSFMIDFDNNTNASPSGRNAAIPNDLGSVLLPSLLKLGRAHITIHCNQQEGSITVLVDGEVAKRWTDIGFPSNAGGGVFFQSQTPDSIKLSNLRISQWEGRFEPDLAPATWTNTDEVSFVNHDKAGGKIQSIGPEMLQMSIGGNLLAIPVERVRQINFTRSSLPAAAQPRGPWDVRAIFAGGGSVSFQLDKWEGAVLSGRSALFGPVFFPSQAIREMDFNLDRPKVAPPPLLPNEFDALDQ